MARRKTKDSTELGEFLLRKIDERTSSGKLAGDVIRGWMDKNNTKRLSLTNGLVMESQVEKLEDLPKAIEKANDYYVHNVKGRCACGQPVSRGAVMMYLGGKTAQDGIIGKIKAKKSIDVHDGFSIGMNCYEGLPNLLDELHLQHNLHERAKKSKAENEKELQDLVLNLSDELKQKLANYGLDAAALQKALELEHLHSLLEGDESGTLFDLDPKNKTNTFNWFCGLEEKAISEGVKPEHVETLVEIWYKMNHAAHMIAKEDLAELMIFSHEFRYRNTDMLLAGVKQDLLYLASLDDNHTYVKEYGKVNIDKHFVHPRTKYRDEKSLLKRTIRELLNQDYITRIEAMGVHNHFPDMIGTRIKINRQVAQKYGLGRTWDYILKEIEPWFEKTKEELHEDYKEWGEIVNDHVFTKDDYLTVKYFLKRAKIGQATDRENYLRNHDIESFENVAPKIIKIGRKLKYARKLKDGNAEKNAFNPLKQEYFLTEGFNTHFSGLTKIEGIHADKFFELLENTGFVEHKEYQKFRQKILDAYQFGIVPKEIIAKTGQEKSRALYYYKMLQNHGVHEQSEKIQDRIKYIQDMHKKGVISELGFTKSLFESKFIDAELEKQINAVYSAVSYVKVPDSWEKISKRVDELNNLEIIIYDKERKTIANKSSKGIKREAAGTKYYNAAEAAVLLEEKDKSVPMPKETAEKLSALLNKRYNNYLNPIRISSDQEYFATTESIEGINEAYVGLEDEIRQDNAKSKLRNTSATRSMEYSELERFFSKMPKVKEFILNKYPEYLNDKRFFGDLHYASNIKNEDIDFVLAFDTKNSAIPKIKQEKSAELSLIIRQELASQIKDEESWKKELDKFYLDQLFPELQRNPAIRKIGQGLGMQKKTGERVLKAYDSEKWESFKPEYLKYNMRRVLQGDGNLLDKAVRGETAKYAIPAEMLSRFEEDAKEKRFNEADTDSLREAFSKIEQTVNDKLINFYSIQYQINRMLDKEREESDKIRGNDYYGHKSSGRHYYHGSYHKRRRF